MTDLKVDFKDVWNAVTSTATLLDSNASYDMGERAFVVPRGLQPWDLDWSEQVDRDMTTGRRWGNRCSDEYLDLGFLEIDLDCSPTVVRCGASWKAGGRHEGKGRYIHDAFLWTVADSTSVAVSVSATGSWSSTPVTVGNGVAQLAGEIHVLIEQLGFQITDVYYDVLIQGNGDGWMWRR